MEGDAYAEASYVAACSPSADSLPAGEPASPSPSPPQHGKKRPRAKAAGRRAEQASYDEDFIVDDEDEAVEEEDWIGSPPSASPWSPRKRRSATTTKTRKKASKASNKKASPEKRGTKRVKTKNNIVLLPWNCIVLSGHALLSH